MRVLCVCLLAVCAVRRERSRACVWECPFTDAMSGELRMSSGTRLYRSSAQRVGLRAGVCLALMWRVCAVSCVYLYLEACRVKVVANLAVLLHAV